MAEAQETGVTVEYGGYEYEFIKKLDSKYICLVCHSVLRDPMLTGCCGQHYCQTCLEQCNSISNDQKCPHCRAVNYDNLLDKPFQREIKSLKIFCINRSLGCKWTNELSKLPRHLESEKDGCEFVRVECILKCGGEINRGYLTKHLHNECPKRPYECGYCGKEDTYMAITGEKRVIKKKGRVPEEKAHYKECPEYFKSCPNQCGKTMKRKEIKGHRIKCPREEVECTFRGPNENNEMTTCGRKLMRSQLPSHEKNCPFRMFECKFCNKASTYVAITGETRVGTLTKLPSEKGHYAKCPDYPLLCKNKCQSGEIKRADMKQHINVCPLEHIPCPVREAGCQVMVYRKDMNDHVTRNQSHHLSLMCRAYTQTKTVLTSNKAELETLRTSLNNTTRKLTTTTEELDSVKKELKDSKRKVDTLTSSLAELETRLEKVQDECRTTTDEHTEIKLHFATFKKAQAQKRPEKVTPTGGASSLQREAVQPTRKRSFWKKK